MNALCAMSRTPNQATPDPQQPNFSNANDHPNPNDHNENNEQLQQPTDSSTIITDNTNDHDVSG